MKQIAKKAAVFMRKKLFNSVPNSISTVILAVGFYFVMKAVLDWAVFNAVWVGDSREVAVPGGATWAFIREKLRFFLYGFYPLEQIWRIKLYYALVALTLLPMAFPKFRFKMILFMSYFLVWPLLTQFIVQGAPFFTPVSTNDWGGLALTLILSLICLLFSFPLGIVMALGRRSEMPVVRLMCTAYIEFFRGIPLITVLFMSSVVVPFFLPNSVSINKLLRVIIGMTFFQSAYLAEVIRGGLQAIPQGQYEAADSLGMRYWRKAGLIIVPQVLRSVISNIGAISISFIKDTTLVLIIGMFDLLGMVYPTSNDSNWLGMEPEGLIFAGLVYWLICYVVSKITTRIEKRVHTTPKGQAPAAAKNDSALEG